MNVLEAERLRDLLAWLEEHHYKVGNITCFSDTNKDGPNFLIGIYLRPKEKKAKP